MPDELRMTPFMKAIYHAIKHHRPEDDIELLTEMFSCFAATAAMSSEVRENPEAAVDIVKRALTAAIIAFESVMVMDSDAPPHAVLHWINTEVGDT